MKCMRLLLSHSVNKSNCFRQYPHPLVSSTTNLAAVLCGQQRRNFSMQQSMESFAKTQSEIFRTISDSTPVEYMQKCILTIHDTTGLPWWASIICTTIVARSMITLPLAVYQQHIMARLQNLQPEMVEISKELNKEMAVAVRQFNWTEPVAKHHYKRSMKKQWNQLIIRDNCHPFKTTILLWFQLPTWICLSVSLRNLCYMLPNPNDVAALITFTQLSVGGFGWLPNLTLPDTSFILPVALGLLNLTIIEVQHLLRVQDKPTKYQKYLTYFLRGVTLIMVPIAANVPSCVALYWTSSSAYGLMQNFLMLSPRFKRFCRVPPTATDIERPYNLLYSKFKTRINNIFANGQLFKR